MTTDHDATRIVRSWLQTNEHESAARVLGLVLDRLDTTPQRRPWWQAWRTSFMNGTMKFATAALGVVLVAGIGLAMYLNRPTGPDAGSPAPLESGMPSPTVVGSPTRTSPGSPQPTEPLARVAYTVREGGCASDPCDDRIWTVAADGTDARAFAPDLPGDQEIVGWSPDGSGLIFTIEAPGSPAVYVALADGSDRDLLCEGGAARCPLLTGSISPDDTRLAYVTTDADAVTSAVAVMTMSTGHGQVLESTRASTMAERCGTASTAGLTGAPRWSPDGARLSFHRMFIGIPTAENAYCRDSVIFLVDADGTGLLQLTPDDMTAFDAWWSPDGETLLFGGGERRRSTLLWSTDFYTIRSDGTDMRALSTDGGANVPHWTSDGRIVYVHTLAGGRYDDVRVVQPDGSGERTVDDGDIAALTALGCTICPYASSAGPDAALTGRGTAYWQPRSP